MGIDIALSAVFGLVLGSFLNVFIYRWPQTAHADLSDTADKSFVFLGLPLSFCPSCRAPIKPWHNIPILSYLVLRGRCASCSVAISVQYPVVEALGGLLVVMAVMQYGWSLTALAAVILMSSLLAVSVIDLKSFLIADQMIIPLTWAGLLVNVDAHFATLQEAVLGAATGYLLIAGLRLAGFWVAKKETIGLGDAKLLAALGAWLGYQTLPFILFMAALGGLAYAMVRFAVKGNRKRYHFLPFGLFLSLAGVVMLFWGDDIRYSYFRLMGI